MKNNVLVSFDSGDDGGIYRVSDDFAIVTTADFFTPIVDDAKAFGAIAAANSLSDIYAMGGTPLSALNLLAFPENKIPEGVIGEILSGAAEKALEAGCAIVGGHSIKDEEIKFGMSVTGKVHPKKIWRNNSIREGDVLVLTKPIGTGCISTAIKKDQADEMVINEAVNSMITLNRIPVEIMTGMNLKISACTDITGFGLAGHLLEMLPPDENYSIEIDLGKIPLIAGAENYLYDSAYLPGGFFKNRDYAAGRVESRVDTEHPSLNALFDPQTSGGLVMAIPETSLPELLNGLEESWRLPVAVIGTVVSDGNNLLRIRD